MSREMKIGLGLSLALLAIWVSAGMPDIRPRVKPLAQLPCSSYANKSLWRLPARCVGLGNR